MGVIGQYPLTRMRRMRQSPWIRQLVAESNIQTSDLVWPVFVCEDDTPRDIPSMKGVQRFSIEELVMAVKDASLLGIPAIALFPVVSDTCKDEQASEAYRSDNLVCRAVQAIRQASIEIGIICDVALDPYTNHGHDGILRDGGVDNDATVECLVKQAYALVEAGCDVLAPSDMMDGRVQALRHMLEKEKYHNTLILSYAAKYASCFYGPFRDAIGSSTALGRADKRTYQMDPTNSKEAMREIALDIDEGADMVMVKPGMPYLDIITRASSNVDVPIFAYQVSGEYCMIQSLCNDDEAYNRALWLESLLAFKRAGATAIVTYAAKEMATWIKEKESC